LSNSSKYKVLFLSSWYPTRIHEFNGDFVKRHAKAVSIYCDVACLHVIYDPELKSKFELIENRDEALNEVIIYFKPYLNLGFLRKLMKLCYYFKGFRLIKKKYGKPQIIHANILVPVGSIAWLFSVFYSIPYVITEHWTGFLNDVYKQKSRLFRFKNNFIAGKASLILPVTDNLSSAMQNCGITNQFKVVPNVVDTNIFKIKSAENKEIKQILHVSDLNDHHKNISGLLRAIKLLSETRQDFVLNIIHNQDNQQIIDYIKELKIDNRFISFLGKKSSSEVAEIMGGSAFLVLFSNYENLPCVIVEALACGIPVLSTNVGGLAEYIDNEKGVLIEKGNEQELLKKLNYLLDNYKNYNKENLHTFAVEQFSAEKVGTSFNEMYGQILND
jgi:glycosyltransferase involved in cell wall biosynthesis